MCFQNCSYNVNGNEASVGDGSKAVLSFLEACNKLFENGFLSHGRISNMESDVLKSINNGYRFFSSWLDQILNNGKT